MLLAPNLSFYRWDEGSRDANKRWCNTSNDMCNINIAGLAGGVGIDAASRSGRSLRDPRATHYRRDHNITADDPTHTSLVYCAKPR